MNYHFFETIYGVSLVNDLLTIVKVAQGIKGYEAETLTAVASFGQLSDAELRGCQCPELPAAAPVILSLPMERVLLRTMPFQGGAAELREALREQLGSIFPFPAGELAFDVYPLVSGDDGPGQEYLVAAVKKETLQEIIRRLNLLRIKPGQVIIDPLTLLYRIDDEAGAQAAVSEAEGRIWCAVYRHKGLAFAGAMRDRRELAEYTAANSSRRPSLEFSPESVAQGAALWHFDVTVSKFTLIDTPPPIPRQLTLFKILSVAVFVSLLLFLYSNNRAVRRDLRQVNVEITKLSPAVDSSLQIKSELGRLHKQAALINGMYARQPAKVMILRELSRILPAKTWLTSLSIKGERFIIAGEAETASGILALLDDSPLFSDIELKAPVVKTESGSEMFRIGGSIHNKAKL